MSVRRWSIFGAKAAEKYVAPNGVALGVLLLVGARITRMNTRWHGVASMALALIVGVLLLTLPYWYTPIFAINIY